MGRVFGNWSKPAFEAWSDFCRRTGFSARQQHDYVKGKNATDIALVIDAMELAFARNVEGFVLITADSDFTPLAVRLRELGFVVIGAGRAAAASLENQPKIACAEPVRYVRMVIEDRSTFTPVPPTDEPSVAWCREHTDEIVRRLNAKGSIDFRALSTGSASIRKLAYHEVLGELWAHWRIRGWTPIRAVGLYVTRRIGSFENKWIGVKRYTQFFGRNSDLYEVSGQYYRLRSAWYDLSPLKDFPFVCTTFRPSKTFPSFCRNVRRRRRKPWRRPSIRRRQWAPPWPNLASNLPRKRRSRGRFSRFPKKRYRSWEKQNGRCSACREG